MLGRNRCHGEAAGRRHSMRPAPLHNCASANDDRARKTGQYDRPQRGAAPADRPARPGLVIRRRCYAAEVEAQRQTAAQRRASLCTALLFWCRQTAGAGGRCDATPGGHVAGLDGSGGSSSVQDSVCAFKYYSFIALIAYLISARALFRPYFRRVRGMHQCNGLRPSAQVPAA